MNKYAKLTQDIITAINVGRMIEIMNPEDGGACNFDATGLLLPGYSGVKIEAAAEAAGTRVFKWRIFGRTRYVIAPDSRSQANARSRNAEAVTATLKNLGYDAIDYCQLD